MTAHFTVKKTEGCCVFYSENSRSSLISHFSAKAFAELHALINSVGISWHSAHN